MSTGSASNIVAGRAAVEAWLDDNPLSKGLAKLQTKLRQWQAGLSKMAGATMGGQLPEPFAAIARFATSPAGAFTALLGAAKHTAEVREEMLKASEATGVAVDKLSKLSYAARRAGIDNATLAGALKKMEGKEFMSAMRGMGGKHGMNGLRAATAGAFAEMGGGDAADRLRNFIKMAEGMNQSQKVGLARQLGISELLPLINQGIDSLDAFTQRAQDLGLVMNEQDAKAGKRFTLAMGDLHDVLMSSVSAIGGALVPVITRLTDTIVGIATSVRDWIKDHQELTQAIFYGSGIIVGAGIALKGLSVISGIASTALGALQIAMKAVSLVFAANPMTLLLAGLATAAVVIGDSMGLFDGFKEKLSGLLTTAKEVFKGIGNAISAGRLDLAMKIAIEGIKVAFLGGLNAIDTATGGWVTNIAKKFVELVRAIGELWAGAVANIAKGLLRLAQQFPQIGKQMGIEVQSGAELKAQAVGQARGNVEQMERMKNDKMAYRNDIPGLQTEIATRQAVIASMKEQMKGQDANSEAAKHTAAMIANQEKIVGHIKDQIAVATDPQKSAAEWDARIAEAKKKLAAAQAKSEDDYGAENLGIANQNVDKGQQDFLLGWEKKMDGWGNAAGKLTDAEKSARDNLAQLQEQAAAAKAARDAADNKPGGKGAGDAQLAMENATTQGTFSGAVAGMLGGPEGQTVVSLLREQIDIMRAHLAEERKQTASDHTQIQQADETNRKLDAIDTANMVG